MEPITHEEMETLFVEMIAELRAAGPRQITVGNASLKWHTAWNGLGLDFEQYHYCGWMEQYFPYDRPLGDYGLSGKPVLMGEFPWAGVAASDGPGIPGAGISFIELVAGFAQAGFSGALAWDFTGPLLSGLALLQSEYEGREPYAGYD